MAVAIASRGQAIEPTDEEIDQVRSRDTGQLVTSMFAMRT